MLGYFLHRTGISELSVDFGHQRLRADQAEIICNALQHNSSLQKLVLDQTTPALLGWIFPGIVSIAAYESYKLSYGMTLAAPGMPCRSSCQRTIRSKI
jgi:hypothetical protein